MARLTNPRHLWLAMISVSAIPRILGAFFLPNAFGDAYVYIRDIGAMSAKLSAHTFALTDLPHAFFVLASLYFVLRQGWVAAAIFAALAGLTRVESWMFIALIPAIQFLRERRISFVAVLILLIPPVFWFYISWKATGNWLACFQARQQYHDWLLAMNPKLGRFALRQVLRDGASLLVSTDIAVFLAAFVAGW